ncbi:lipoprotein [Clostridia bacterium]|nr:lipoprotein [Clostridia bacterium]
MKKSFTKKAFRIKLVTTAVTVLALAALSLTACGAKKDTSDDKTIKFAVTNLKVYEDTTKVLASEVEKLGYKLDYKLLADDVQINEAVESGEYFANYHQHTPYMDEFNKTHNGHLAAAFKVFTDRSGIFSKKYKSLDELPDGAQITIPNDAGNNFRPLLILADAGLITLKEGVEPINVTTNDIVDNPKHLKFIEVDYTMLAKSLEEADAGFLYATVAAEIDLDFNKDVLAAEKPEFSAADIIAVREENLGSEKAKILEQAYKSDAVKKALSDSYDGREILEPAW